MKNYVVRIKVPGTYYDVKVKAAAESEAIEMAKKKTPKWISVEPVKEG